MYSRYTVHTYCILAGCQAYGFTGSFFAFVSINTLAAIAIDRYRVIRSPLQAAVITRKKTAAKYIGITWLWALLWATPPLFGWGHYHPEGFQTACTFDYLTQDARNVSFVTGMYVSHFIAPVGIIAYCYVATARSISTHNQQFRANTPFITRHNAMQHRHREIQVAKVAAVCIASFLLSWTPYATVALLGMICPHKAKVVTPYLAQIPVMFAKASASYNPIIYAFMHPVFRAQLFLATCEPFAGCIGVRVKHTNLHTLNNTLMPGPAYIKRKPAEDIFMDAIVDGNSNNGCSRVKS